MINELYEDGQMKIEDSPQGENSHVLWIGNGQYFLERNVLKELARIPRGSLEGRLNCINPEIMRAAKRAGLDVDSIGIALLQARIAELTEELSYAYQ